MAPHIKVELHRHNRAVPIEITKAVTRVEWSKSISAPWQSLSVSWKATLGDSFVKAAVGDWITVRVTSAAVSGDGVAVAFCHIDSIGGGATSGPMGSLRSEISVIQATGWWALLQKVNVYSVMGTVDDVGTMFGMGTWSAAIGAITNNFATGQLGAAFEFMFARLAAVELPESLVGGKKGVTLAQVIPIVHSPEQQAVYAPDRVDTIESVDIGGGSPSRLASMFGAYSSTVTSFFQGVFQPEPLLIELFPSFEPAKNLTSAPNAVALGGAGATGLAGTVKGTTSSTAPANQSTSPPVTGSQRVVSPVLHDALGGWETLIYRIKPFRDRPLREAAVAYASYTHVETEAIVTRVLRASMPWVSTETISEIANEVGSSSTKTTSDTNAAVSGLLSSKFQDPTWNYSTPRYIPRSLIRNFQCQRKDSDRINACSITLAIEGGNGIEGIREAGLPISYDTEIRRHGLRLIKPSWTFTIPEIAVTLTGGDTPKSSPVYDQAFVAYLRTICAQLMQFYKNNHLYGSGQVSLNLTEAVTVSSGKGTAFDKVLELKPGEVIALNLHEQEDTFFAYAETITHTFEVRDGGIEAANTNVAFSRGHFGVIQDALSKDAEVPLRPVTAAQAKAREKRASNEKGPWRTADPMDTATRKLNAKRIYTFFVHHNFAPAWAMGAVHQAWFESEWNPSVVRWTSAELTYPGAVGLFQMTLVEGLGSPKPSFAGNRLIWYEDDTKHWNGKSLDMVCHRLRVAAISRQEWAGRTTNKSLTIAQQYWELLNSAQAGGYRKEIDAGRQHRLDVGKAKFKGYWNDAEFSQRNTVADRGSGPGYTQFSDSFGSKSVDDLKRFGLTDEASSIIDGM